MKDSSHESVVTFDWEIPDDIHISTSRTRDPIFSFKVRVFETAKFFVTINARTVIDTSLSPDNVKVYWEVISWRNTFPNRISGIEKIQLSMREGHMRISDVVIWYQINR